MPHLRKRQLLSSLHAGLKFWPVLGVVGLRQSGKTTLLEKLIPIKNHVSFDDEDLREEATHSSKGFLARFPTPLLIDEVQKVPTIFDSIKLKVDRTRIPGQYLLTGSTQFSSKVGIRESLTGRIQVLQLYPFTLSEAHQAPLEVKRATPHHRLSSRFTIEQLNEQLLVGGLPVPLFTRNQEYQKQYFSTWMNTTLMRDAARAYGKNYDPDFADSIVRQTATILREGEIPTVAHYKQDSRRVKRYLQAFELIFFFQKIPVHESGVGRDGWLPTDSGVANAILDGQRGEGGTLSLARIFILNEILALNQNAGHPIRLLSYKSKHGKVVDLIWNDCAIKISNRIRSQVSYDEKGLAECIKKLKLKKGYLLVPYSHHVSIDKSIQVVPWTHWS